ncbi:hypothetical protein ACHAXA_007690 [Cyclostephanos tholiformis]|uniref:Uncharacterized protein n=1 Tax=Cyclostephanos tholiformis TaxID=382380 RepID=A0ABD3SDF7_9STRA
MSFAFVSLHPACHLPATSTTVAAMTTASEQQNPSRIFLAYPLTQVVSDIDDTLKSSGGLEIGGVSLGGVDVQYDRGDFYPGVFQFMWELSLHTIRLNQRHYGQYKIERGGENSFSDLRLSPPKVAVLTARAEELKAALEIKDKSKLAQAFRKTGESSIIYPTKEWGVGPLDQEAGETMLREYPEVVQAVFLHVVSPDPPSTFPPSGIFIPPPKLINGRPLVFFRTYVGAAAKAAQLGLMELDGLMRVIEEAEMTLTAQGVPMEDSKWVDLSRDIDEAHRTIGEMY